MDESVNTDLLCTAYYFVYAKTLKWSIGPILSKAVGMKSILHGTVQYLKGKQNSEVKSTSIFHSKILDVAILGNTDFLQVCPLFLDETWLIHVHYNLYGCHAKVFFWGADMFKKLCLFFLFHSKLRWRVNVCIGNWKALETFRLGLFCVYTKPL